MNYLNEESIMEVIADLMTEGSLEEFNTEDQMIIIDLITEGIKKYHAKELDKFLEGLHTDYIKRKTLSDL